MPGAPLNDRAMALREIASLAKKCPILKDVKQEEILAGFQEHHIPDSVYLPTGVTILHCHLESVDEFVVGLVTVFHTGPAVLVCLGVAASIPPVLFLLLHC